MQQRLRVGAEFELQMLRGDLQIDVGAQLGGDPVELRAGVPVERRREIGIGEDQRLGDVAKRDVVGEQREVGLALARSASKGRSRETGCARGNARAARPSCG